MNGLRVARRVEPMALPPNALPRSMEKCKSGCLMKDTVTAPNPGYTSINGLNISLTVPTMLMSLILGATRVASLL